MKSTQIKKWSLLTSFLRKHSMAFALTLFSGVIANVFVILIPVSLGKYFDFLFGYQSHRAAYMDLLPFSFWETMPQYLTFLGCLIVLRFMFQYVQRFSMSYLGEHFVKDLREKLFVQQLKIQTSVYEDRGVGRYLLRHSGDLKSIQNYLTRGIIRFSTDVILLVMAVGFLFWLNKTIFLIIISGFVVSLIIVFILNKILFRVSVTRRNVRSGLLSFVNRQLMAVSAIKVFNKQVTEIGKYNKRSDKLFKAGINFQKIYNLIYTIIPTLLYGILLVVLYFIYREKETQNIEFHAGEMLSFILLFLTVLPIFRRVMRVSTVWELGNISFAKLINVFELPSEENDETLLPYVYKKGEILCKEVSFAYDKEVPIFQKLSFTIKPLRINQIKIGNGEGKTTLIKLFAGLYTPTKGHIYYDKQPLDSLNLKSVRKKVTFVSDEFALVGRSVFEVVSYSRSKSKMDKAQQVLDMLQEGIPEKMKLSLRDKVAENGSNLSKTQQKMLQYVRAILSDKPILIIDEPIRNLEKNTKLNILSWLLTVKSDKTIVFLCKTWRETLVPINHIITIQKK